MIISDLNYLEITTQEVFGGQNIAFGKVLNSTSSNTANFNSASNINEVFTKNATINVATTVRGNSATLFFDNEAVGRNTNVQGAFSQLAVAGSLSSQAGNFVAAAVGS